MHVIHIGTVVVVVIGRLTGRLVGVDGGRIAVRGGIALLGLLLLLLLLRMRNQRSIVVSILRLLLRLRGRAIIAVIMRITAVAYNARKILFLLLFNYAKK